MLLPSTNFVEARPVATDLAEWRSWLTAIEREYDEAVEEHMAAEAAAERLGDGEGRRGSPAWERAAACEGIAREHAVMAYTRYKAALVAYCARVDYEDRQQARRREAVALAA